jgi:Uma2 family endonuclease
MYALVSAEKIQLPPGSVVVLPATWQDYQILCHRRGDGAVPRIRYRHNQVLLMAPLAVHGRDANLLADIVKTLLDHDNREYDAFTPVTMELPEESGIEPDYCFYIDHWEAVSGKQRIDWRNDPPPDLAIEIDVQDYAPFRVPEIWLLRRQKLTIYQLQGDDYQVTQVSRYFPTFALLDWVETCLTITYQRNSSTAIRYLRQQLIQ